MTAVNKSILVLEHQLEGWDYRMLDDKVLGNKIRKLRLQRNLSIKEFAGLTGISVTHIRNIENGYKSLSMSNFIEICNVLNVFPHEILYPFLTEGWKKEDVLNALDSIEEEHLNKLIGIINIVPEIIEK